VTGQEVTDASSSNVYGAGVRLIQGNDEVYGYTNQVDEASLERIIQNLRVSFEGPKYEAKPLGDSAPYDSQVKIPMETKTTQEKAEKLLPLTKIMADYDERIVQSIAMLSDMKQDVLVVNSEGVYQKDERHYARVILMAWPKTKTACNKRTKGLAARWALRFLMRWRLRP